MMDLSLLAAHDFALIDQVAFDDLPTDLCVLHIVPRGLENDAHLLPLLLPLKTLTPPQQIKLLEQHAATVEAGQAPWLGTLLATALDAEVIRDHLASRLIVKLELRDKALLRYHDPRAFMQLQWMFNPSQRQALHGPIHTWSVFLDGEWRRLTAPTQATEHPTWTFDALTSARLERIGLINQVITALEQPAPIDRITLGQKIDRHLMRAHDLYNIERDEDRIAFALHALQVHPDFDRHHTIQSIIYGLPAKQSTYRDATALLDEGAWQQIAKEITSEGNLRT